MLIYGINPVLEAMRARRVRRLRVAGRQDRRMAEVIAAAAEHGVAVEYADAQTLDRITRGGVHQGVAADVEELHDCSVQDLIAAAGGSAPLIVVLDGVEDPHNVGAILRTADAAGATGVVRQARHAAALDGIVAKASAGAVSVVRIATVVNIARAIEQLKDGGVWSVGLADEAAEPYTAIDFTLPTAIVLGAEGSGLRRLVRERCDRLARIPMAGRVSSLNVSVAAGVVLYEAVRQRVIPVGAKC
ncbi:MAG TPA: 23S rRNA (guanosine(2251)-2'-O)-methyltransferase RlmB [Vicinamibacterales bacterium]|jgi:23S rRNA (guanosine2251-2'-O)-methyltransferase|nr:23S rRNA (guanosine(2251)-2'-O)-methyltransferase RlmB [Vicinamibacterales bacterium]